ALTGCEGSPVQNSADGPVVEDDSEDALTGATTCQAFVQQQVDFLKAGCLAGSYPVIDYQIVTHLASSGLVSVTRGSLNQYLDQASPANDWLYSTATYDGTQVFSDRSVRALVAGDQNETSF